MFEELIKVMIFTGVLAVFLGFFLRIVGQHMSDGELGFFSVVPFCCYVVWTIYAAFKLGTFWFDTGVGYWFDWVLSLVITSGVMLGVDTIGAVIGLLLGAGIAFVLEIIVAVVAIPLVWLCGYAIQRIRRFRERSRELMKNRSHG